MSTQLVIGTRSAWHAGVVHGGRTRLKGPDRPRSESEIESESKEAKHDYANEQ